MTKIDYVPTQKILDEFGIKKSQLYRYRFSKVLIENEHFIREGKNRIIYLKSTVKKLKEWRSGKKKQSNYYKHYRALGLIKNEIFYFYEQYNDSDAKEVDRTYLKEQFLELIASAKKLLGKEYADYKTEFEIF
mgnify:CR=1 FL=1